MQRAWMRGLLVTMALAAASSAPSLAAQGDGPTKAQIERGRELAFERTKGNCLACHKIEGGELAGTVGPRLTNMKERYPDREQLFKRVWDETQFNPLTVMPPFGRHKILTKQEINRVVDFLYTL